MQQAVPYGGRQRGPTQRHSPFVLPDAKRSRDLAALAGRIGAELGHFIAIFPMHLLRKQDAWCVMRG
jgi:hypothetical protein